MRDRPRNPGWPGRPDTGEIEIDGQRWRWVTVGKLRDRKEAERGSISWCVRFCSVSRPEDSFWYELPDPADAPDRPSEEVLRDAFQEGRPAATS